MKNTKSKIKVIKIGKQSGTTYCFGCKDNTKKNLIVFFVNLINQDF